MSEYDCETCGHRIVDHVASGGCLGYNSPFGRTKCDCEHYKNQNFPNQEIDT